MNSIGTSSPQSVSIASGKAGWANVGPDWAQLGGADMPCPGLEGWMAVGAALRRRSVNRLTIIADADRICRFGLPVDRLWRTMMVGSALPDEWARLAERCSDLTHKVDDSAAALALLAERHGTNV